MAVVRYIERQAAGDQIIHAGSDSGNDVTLCGYALEGENCDDELEATERGKINCAHCIQTIRTAKAIPERMIAKDPRP